MIVEDDVDWDLNIKSQMLLLAEKTHELGGSHHDPSKSITANPLDTNPYGNDWDMLWLGSCANPPGPPDAKTFPGEQGTQTHWVFYAHGGICCNWAYAVTRATAKSLAAYLQDLDEPTDYAMSKWCGPNNCVVVWPELFGSFRPPGGPRKGSDNDAGRAAETEDLEKGWTRNIVNSATVDVVEKFGRKAPWSGP